MYHIGTIAQFNDWHDAAKLAENIPPDGKINFRKGRPVLDKGRTTGYSIAHQSYSDKRLYYWIYEKYQNKDLTVKTHDDLRAEGFFPPKEDFNLTREDTSK